MFTIWLALLSLVVGALVWGLIPAYIADRKGRPAGAWYLFGVALWLPAMIAVILSEDLHRKEETRRHEELIDALDDIDDTHGMAGTRAA